MCDAVERYVAKKCAEACAVVRAEEQSKARKMLAEAERRQAEAIAEAKAESNLNTARSMLSMGRNTHAEIAKISTLSLSEVDSLALSMGL